MSRQFVLRGRQVRWGLRALLMAALVLGGTVPIQAQAEAVKKPGKIVQAKPNPIPTAKPQKVGKPVVLPKIEIPVDVPKPAATAFLKPVPVFEGEDGTTRARIVRAFHSKAALDVREAPLREVVELISKTHKIPIIFDKRALDDVGLTTDMPVTMRLENVSLRSLLRILLDELELRYVVRDEFLMITTPEEAENQLTVRLYPVTDLASRPRPALFANRSRGRYDLIVELIETYVAPDTWADVGGPASVDAFEPRGFLAIVQTDQQHDEIEALLNSIRRARALPPSANDKQRFLPIQVLSETEAAAHARIEEALEQKVTLEFADAPLSDVAEFIAKKHGIPVMIDHRSLDDVGLSSDSAVAVSLQGVSLRSALRVVLDDLDLVYVISNEVLTITTPEESENRLESRIYVVSDLLTSVSLGEQSKSREKQLGSLVALIVSTVAPETWDDVGGAGAVRAVEPWEWLVISQTLEVHEQVQGLLSAVRRVSRQATAEPGPAAPARRAQAQDGTPGVPQLAPRMRQPFARAAQPAGGMMGARFGGGRPMEVRIYDVPKNLAVEELVPAIIGLVEPTSWQVGGAGGSVHAVGQKLLIRQTERGHDQVQELLDALGPRPPGRQGGMLSP